MSPNDSNSWRNAFECLAKSQDMQIKFGLNIYKQYIEKYSFEVAIEKELNLYHELINIPKYI